MHTKVVGSGRRRNAYCGRQWSRLVSSCGQTKADDDDDDGDDDEHNVVQFTQLSQKVDVLLYNI